MATRAVRVVPTDDSADNGALDSIMEAANSGGGGGEAIGLPDKLTMQGDVERLNNRLRRMNAGLLNPRGKIMQYWDFFTLSALFYTATVTPYEVCMMWGEPKFYNPTSAWLTPLFIVNWFVNVVFMVDICFNFFLPYREPIAKGGGMVKNHRLIAKNYLCSWFPLDIISVVPVDNIMMAIDTTQIKGASMLAAIRLLRLLRLIKLARILRASRIFSRWENSISLSYAKQDLIRWTIIIMILLHWLACILGILAQLMAPPRTDALAEAVQTAIAAGDPQCYGCMPDGDLSPGNLCASPCLTPCEVAQLARLRQPNAYDNEIATEESRIYLGQSWVCRYANDGAIAPPVWHAEVWIAAMYVALIQLGGGVGSIVPMNWLEYIVFSFGIILGSVTWAMVVGTICATMATGDPKANEFKAGMDALNYFLEDMQMPAALRVRAREYFRNKRDLLKTASYNDLLHEFSPDLQADIVLHMSAKTLDIVWYLSSLEQGARVELAMRLERGLRAAREDFVGEAHHPDAWRRRKGGQHPHAARPLGRRHGRQLRLAARHAPRVGAHLCGGGDALARRSGRCARQLPRVGRDHPSGGDARRDEASRRDHQRVCPLAPRAPSKLRSAAEAAAPVAECVWRRRLVGRPGDDPPRPHRRQPEGYCRRPAGGGGWRCGADGHHGDARKGHSRD